MAHGGEALVFVIVMAEDANVASVGQGAAEGLEAELIAGAVNVGDGLEELVLVGDGGEAVEVHGVIVLRCSVEQGHLLTRIPLRGHHASAQVFLQEICDGIQNQ